MKKTQRHMVAEYSLGWPYFPIIRDLASSRQNAGASINVKEGKGILSKTFYISGRPMEVLGLVFETRKRVAAVRTMTAEMNG